MSILPAPGVDRAEPGGTDDERDLLDGWLDYYRATLLYKCVGLTPEQMAERSCPPSAMSLAGLIRHMTEMERMYAHRLADPEVGLLYCTDERPDGDFDDATAASASADVATYEDHCDKSRRIVAGRQLDDRFGTARPRTLRWTYLYLAKEYARHLGHADLLRERIDGTTGE
jgi:uncharacterized protein DUF664